MSAVEVRDRIQLHVSAFYDELRKQMAVYQTMPEAFPDHLKGPRRIVAVLGHDGVVVSHWAADQDTFEFHQANKTMIEIANEQSGGGFEWDFPPGSDLGIRVAGIAMYEGTDTSGPLHWKTPWETMEVNSRVSSIQWNEELARSQARNDVLTYVTGHLLHLSKETKPPEIFAKLESVIDEFGTLLRSGPKEEVVQRYLTANPGLLSQSAVDIKPKVALGKEHETDFVIEQNEQDYILIEIERPDFPLFTRRGDPTARLTHAQRQVEDWLDWISDNKDYAQRHVLPGISEPEGWVIIGLRSRMDKKSKKALSRKNRELHRIKILTFDDLISTAKSYLSNLRSYRLWTP